MIRCPGCGAELPDGATGVCPRCGAPAATFMGTIAPPAPGRPDAADDSFTQAVTPRPAMPPTLPAPPDVTQPGMTTPAGTTPKVPATGVFVPGTAFGGRYHVIRLLGAGGMGAVYQAWDNELGVAVALKVIRPEVMVDPDGARDLERRFKRELLLARQVTHKNVVRIHDLGEVDGIKYITMPYIQGTDLATRLHKDGRLPVAKVVSIARQVAQGLAAAHEAGVVHRDLKPANIMIDEEERAIIMDFGIARSASAGGTLLGTVVGTLEYMAPEQAMGQPVDHRADLYTFGLILYDLLLGRRSAARAESAVAELMQRMQRSLPPARSIDSSIPEPLDDILATCMQPDPALRFQTTVELVTALENLDTDGHAIHAARRPDATTRRRSRPAFAFPSQPAPAPAAPPVAPAAIRGRAPAMAAAFALLLIGGSGYYFIGRTSDAPAATETSSTAEASPSLAILPFRNQTGDASLDWMGAAVAEMVKGAVPQNQLRIVSSERVFQVLRDLRVAPDREIDGGTMRRLSEFTNARTIVSGSYAKAGDGLRLDAVLRDAHSGSTMSVSSTIASQRELMDGVAVLARGVAEKMVAGASTAATGAVTSRLSTQSMDALKAFAEGIDAGRRGNHLEALKKFESAVAADPQFALAYAKLAQTYANLGHDSDAERASRQALDRASSLPERERYLVNATHAEVLHNNKQAIEAYEQLLSLAPGDPEVRFSLARRLEATGAFEQARTHYEKGIEADPKFFEGLFALGRLEVQLKNPQGALDHLNRALSVAVQLDNDEGRGSALNALGIAYKRLNRLTDAQFHYSQALEIRQRIGDKRGMAATLNELGQVQDMSGKPAEALQTYQRSLVLRREIGDKRGLAVVLNNVGVLHQAQGRLVEALTHYKEALQLQTELGNADYQALGLHNIGITLTAHGDYAEAAGYLSRAQQVREKLNVPAAVAETLRGLGELNVRLAEYEQAVGHYLKALDLSRGVDDRRGAALASLGMAAVFKHQGRYGAALDAAKDAVDGLRGARESGASFAEALAGYAHAWSLMARHDQAQVLFNEASSVASKLPDAAVMAQLLNLQGEDALIAGKSAEAVTLLGHAVQKAESSNDRYLMLLTRLNLAKAQTAAGRAQAATTTAASVAKEAARLGLKQVTVDASLTSGEALVVQKHYARAAPALDAALRDAERLNLRPLMARAHYAVATALRLGGRTDAADPHYRQASRLLAELQGEAGSNSLAKRADFSGIAAAGRTSPVSE